MGLSDKRKAIYVAVSKGYSVNNDGVLVRHGKPIGSKQRTGDGYLCFSIRFVDDGIKKLTKILVHRLQAYQKYGEDMFADGIVCRHLNNDKNDNSANNIAIGTHGDNAMDNSPAFRTGKAINASSKLRRFNDDEIKSIKKDRQDGLSYKSLSEKYNVGKGTLSYLFNEAKYAKTVE